MNGFSASEAALEGFLLTRERPAAIAAWTGVYAICMVVLGEVMLKSLGPEAMEIARKGRLSPQDAEVIATKLSGSVPAFLLVLLLAVTLVSIITAGIYRLVLRPNETGFVHLRFGADELRLTAMNLILFAIGMVCLVLGFAVIAAAESASPALAVVVASAVAIGTIWVGVRLSLATPMTFQTRHLSLRAAWELTRGQFLPMLFMIFLSVIFYVIIWVLITVIWFVAVRVIGGPDALTSGDGTAALIAGAAGFVISMLIQVIQLLMIYAPFAVAYQQLHGDRPANPSRVRAEPA